MLIRNVGRANAIIAGVNTLNGMLPFVSFAFMMLGRWRWCHGRCRCATTMLAGPAALLSASPLTTGRGDVRAFTHHGILPTAFKTLR